MRINHIANIYETHTVKPANSHTERGTTNPSKIKRDSVAVSPSARSFTAALQSIAATPDIREDRVAQIRARIESGTYKPDASKIADKILG